MVRFEQRVKQERQNRDAARPSYESDGRIMFADIFVTTLLGTRR